MGVFATLRPEGVGAGRAADRPDRQDDPAEALHRRRHFCAIQHRVGVEGADVIVAINTDRHAPILDFAHYAVATDALRFLPALTEAFRARISPHAKDRLAG